MILLAATWLLQFPDLEMSFTLFINSLLIDQHSSCGVKLHIMMFAMLEFLWKIVPTSMMQLAISWGESVEILLVPHWTTMFHTNGSSYKLMARQRKFSTRSPPMPKFIAFSGTKYFFHTIWYRGSPSMMESPNRSILGFVTLVVKQCLRWHSIQLDLLKHPRAFKTIKNIPKRKPDNWCKTGNLNLIKIW